MMFALILAITIAERMQQFVDQGRTAGLVVMIQQRGEVVAHEAKGWQDREGKVPMSRDSIFQVASMTKPVTGAAIMMLVDEGLVALGDPVEKYLPEFRGKPRKPTVRDLLTHTSGLGGSAPGLAELFQKRDRTLAEAVLVYSQQPLAFEPGTRWQYSNMGIATLGRIVEVVSGKSYQDFLAERLFEPLGMRDSFFFPRPEHYPRIAAMYAHDGAKLTRAEFDLHRKGARYPAPEGGLYSTARDMVAFYQMMLDGGSWRGRRLLSRAAVEAMTLNHTGDLKAGFAPGFGYGLSWGVVKDNDGLFRMNSIGTYGHGGAWRTYGWVDPAKRIAGAIMQQRQSRDGDMADEFNAIMSMAAAR
jgi:CubicO group peptidase (beta-lactamase class C family)